MSDAGDPLGAQQFSRRSTLSLIITVATIVLVGLSLRIPTISLAPLVPSLMEDIGHGETFVSLLTSIPLVLTLLAAPIAPPMANRFGRGRLVTIALIGIVAGIVLRSTPGDGPLLIGAGLLGFSIAVLTVLVPSIIHAEHVSMQTRMIGSYSMSLSLGPALALGLTIPLTEATGLGWRGVLLLWGVGTVIAVVLWLVYIRIPHVPTASTGHRGSTTTAARGQHRTKNVLTDLNVWLLAFYLGVTSLTFYTTSAWLPAVLVRDGMSEQSAGGVTALISMVAIPCGLIAPIAIRRGLSRLIAPISPIFAIMGLVMLLAVGPWGALLIAALLGIAQGLCLGVSYNQIVTFGRSPAHTASVSAATSAVGVALAAVGPTAFGFGLETAGSSTPSVIGLAAVIAAQSVIGLRTSQL